MKKALLIAYPFPPMVGGGVQRTVKFAKYLPDFGWEPHVLTRHVPSREADGYPDEELPSGLRLHRCAALDYYIPGRLMGIAELLLRPDVMVLWSLTAYPTARRLIREHGISAIYSTGGPHSSHLLARRLKLDTKVPWVADFRDPWTQYAFEPYRAGFYRDLDLHLERKVARDADAVVQNNERLLDEYAENIGEWVREKCTVIPNGYDPEDFAGIEKGTRKDDRMRVFYVGRTYPGTDLLLRGIRRFMDKYRKAGANTSFTFVGNPNTSVLEAEVKQMGLAGLVRALPPVAHAEAVRIMVNADLLLLHIPRVEGLDSGLVSQKLYEYLASGTQILAAVPDGSAAAGFLREKGAGVLADPSSPEEIARALGECYKRFEAGDAEADVVEMRGYERRELTGKLADLFDELTQN